jgi:drug/metabolite transporter (DMT)-like permease
MTSAALVPDPGGTGLASLARRSPVGVVAFGVAVSSTGPVMIAAADVLSGVAFSFWRLWFGVAVLLAATAIQRHTTAVRTDARGWLWALGCGVMFAVHQLMFVTALRATSVVDVTLMNTVAPVVVAVLAVPAFDERPGPGFRLWSLLAMAGAAAVALSGATGPEGDPAGILLAAGNVVFYAIFFVGSKLARPHVEPIPFLLGNAVAAAVAVSAFVVLVAEPVTPASRHDLALCFAVAAFPGLIGHFSVTWALRWVPANLPPVMMLAIPAMSGALAWVLLDQTVRATQVLAGLVTLVGVAGAIRSPSAPAVGADEALLLAEET